MAPSTKYINDAPTYLSTPPISNPPSPNEPLTTRDLVLHEHLLKPTNAGSGSDTTEVVELWLYILSLFFSAEEAYYPKLSPDGGTGGVYVEVWRKGNYLTKQGEWTAPEDRPVFVLLCLPRARWAHEFPGVRFTGREGRFDLTGDGGVATAAQAGLRDRFVRVLGEAPGLGAVNGGMACGCMVRLFRCRGGGKGELKGWHKTVLDLVYGVPGCAMDMVRRVLERVRKGG